MRGEEAAEYVRLDVGELELNVAGVQVLEVAACVVMVVVMMM